MRDHGLLSAVTCIMIFFLVACQINQQAGGVDDKLASPEITRPTSRIDQERLVEIYEKAQTGVVSIRTINEGRTLLGSGFVLDKEGHILTNLHVVSEGESIEVLLPTGNLLEGEIIGKDEAADLAVLQVDELPEMLNPLALGDTDLIKVGQSVLAIGNPVGLRNTMTSGIISGLGGAVRNYGKVNEEQAMADASVIQTDAAINQGNSGGPLLDLDGNVIGINSARLTTGFNSSVSGIGFSTASNVLKVITPQLIKKGEFDYPYLGIVSIGDLNLAEQKALRLDQRKGVYVAEVIEDSPADIGGLRSGSTISPVPGVKSGGDLIIGVDGKEVLNFADLMMYILINKAPGEDIVLNVIRGEETLNIVVKLGARK